MAKRSGFTEVLLSERQLNEPAYRWLYRALRREILEGRLRPGTKIPATRNLASEYGLSRGTIVTAFEELKSEGYVEGSVGSGTYVSKVLPDDLLEVRREEARRTTIRNLVKPRRRLSAYGRSVEAFASFSNRVALRAFRSNLPALDEFPVALWAQIGNRRLKQASMATLAGCEPIGYAPLRQAIAEYATLSRGVVCSAEQVIVVSGVQEALDLTARLLLNQGDVVCMEEPGYVGATRVFRAVGARIVPLAIDEYGAQLPAAGARGAKLAYLTPAHQAPLGVTMRLRRRLELLEWARKNGSLIFEDDYDGEYRYSGRPAPSLQGLDRNGLVLFAGSFSKVLFPALRLGYLIVPEDLVERFAAAKSILNRHAPLLEQTVLCEFIDAGHFARHLRRMREVYSERLGLFLEEGKKKLAGMLDISEIEAGLQTTAWLTRGFSSDAAVKAAAARGIDVTSLEEFYWSAREPKSPRRQGLQMGFAAIRLREIRRGMEELARALETLGVVP